MVGSAREEWREFGRRLAQARKTRGLTQEAVAAHFQIERPSVAEWESGRSPPSAVRFPELRKLLGVSIDWLLTGEEGLAVVPGNHDLDAVHFGGDDYTPVDAYDIRAAAGHGSINQDGEPLYRELFRTQWLRTLDTGDLDRLALMWFSGDSMRPTIEDGDQGLLNRSITKIERDGIYVIRLADELKVKRCSRTANKLLTIKSDNPQYPTEEGVRDKDIGVLGRVIWLARDLRG